MRIHLGLIFAALLSLLPAAMVGQSSYNQSIGVRTGSATGLAYKQFLAPSLAAEGQLVYRQEGLLAVAMIQPHLELGYRSGYALFAGVGVHAGFRGIFLSEPAGRAVWGVDLVAGFEYVAARKPFAFSLDIKPALELADGQPILSGNQAGVSLRYILP